MALVIAVGRSEVPRASMYMRNRPSASCTIEGANNRSDMWATSGQGHNRIPGSGENSSPSSETALRNVSLAFGERPAGANGGVEQGETRPRAVR
ncbi:MAG: hypothetical protein Ct9H300mP1_09440 [Planctomycetaceae bacterium]|nr:MAG: hypothetical protein Ct9H300mP1_09440 [Planctomycetaceae bacterium]